MCVTNANIEVAFKTVREIEREGIDKIPDIQLAEFLAYAKIIADCVEENQKRVKKEMLERGIEDTYYFPEIEKKVFQSDGKSSTKYNVSNIYDMMADIDLEDEFFSIVSIVKARVDEMEDEIIKKDVEKILEENSTSAKGDPTITVAKMSKKDKEDHN